MGKLTISDILNDPSDRMSKRTKRELELCALMLTREELNSLSSIRTAYCIARDRVIEDVIKKTDPWLYEKVNNKPVPVFGLNEIAREFVANTQD